MRRSLRQGDEVTVGDALRMTVAEVTAAGRVIVDFHTDRHVRISRPEPELKRDSAAESGDPTIQ